MEPVVFHVLVVVQTTIPASTLLEPVLTAANSGTPGRDVMFTLVRYHANILHKRIIYMVLFRDKFITML